MKASEFVEKLQGLIEKHGDLPIITIGEDGERMLVNNEPSIWFEKRSIFKDTLNYTDPDVQLVYVDGFTIG